MNAAVTAYLAVRERITASWEAVDHAEGVEAEAHYTRRGELQFGYAVFSGRREIADMYAQRRARGPRTARHLVVNDRIAVEGNSARATYILVLYAADGTPILPSTPPTGIFDVADDLVCEDGTWLLRLRHLKSVFRLPGAELAVPFGDTE